MHRSSGFIVLFLYVFDISLVQSVHHQQPSNSNIDSLISGYRARYDERERRAISMTQKGFAALIKLTHYSLEVPIKSQVYRRYEKTGNFHTAVRDFYSVKPTNVKIHPGKQSGFKVPVETGSVISGNVGNRRLLLRENGENGHPTLDVIETKFEPGPFIDQIIYKSIDIDW